MNIAIYNETGQVIRNISCPDSMVDAQVKTGEYVYKDTVDPETQYIDIVSKTIREKPSKPSKYHIFNYDTKSWQDPRTTDSEWLVVRAKRDKLLSESDWTQMPDVSIPTKEVWALYRQALRNITQQPDPFNIVWPVAPV